MTTDSVEERWKKWLASLAVTKSMLAVVQAASGAADEVKGAMAVRALAVHTAETARAAFVEACRQEAEAQASWRRAADQPMLPFPDAKGVLEQEKLAIADGNIQLFRDDGTFIDLETDVEILHVEGADVVEAKRGVVAPTPGATEIRVTVKRRGEKVPARFSFPVAAPTPPADQAEPTTEPPKTPKPRKSRAKKAVANV